MFDRALPVQIDPQDGESGVGLCLRLAERNRMSLVELRALLDMSKADSFKYHHVLRLAMLARLDPADLEQRFIAPLKGIRTGLKFAGHSLRLRAFHRGRRPQVCPICIQRHRFCRTEWDFTLSCACVEHMCHLVDRCPSCDSVLRWDRPSVQWSHCRHYLGREARAALTPGTDYVEMQAVLQALLTRTPLPSHWLSRCFPAGVSIDGWFSLVWAFGAMTTPHQPPRPGTFSSVPSSAAVRAVVSRASERMKKFSARHSHSCPELKALIAEAPLLGLIREGDQERDRLAALEVYRFLAGDRAVDALLKLHRVSTQLSLL